MMGLSFRCVMGKLRTYWLIDITVYRLIAHALVDPSVLWTSWHSYAGLKDRKYFVSVSNDVIALYSL